jgi:predicted metal-dependent phosphotriesterase family hydrolase
LHTVRGPVEAGRLGFALAHEHLFSNFGGDPAEPALYDTARLLAAVVPAAEKAKALGARVLFDATTAYFGRAPRLLDEISRRTGLHVVTNTGYYGAANDRYVPQHACDESPDQLARRWSAEFERGIGDTGIRPGFIKLKQVLLSHDGNSFRFGGRPPRLYKALFTTLVPKLRTSGFSARDVRRLTVENAAAAFGVRVRRL